MSECPHCKANISDASSHCEYCGKTVIQGDALSSIANKTTTWQKIVIIVSIFILIAIGFSFKGAEKRENKAAQNLFNHPAEQIVAAGAAKLGLTSAYGEPAITSHFETKKGVVFVSFPKGPMTAYQAADFGLTACRALAREYVNKGYMPRALAVSVSSGEKSGAQIHYGIAVYNGNYDLIGWEPSVN